MFSPVGDQHRCRNFEGSRDLILRGCGEVHGGEPARADEVADVVDLLAARYGSAAWVRVNLASGVPSVVAAWSTAAVMPGVTGSPARGRQCVGAISGLLGNTDVRGNEHAGLRVCDVYAARTTAGRLPLFRRPDVFTLHTGRPTVECAKWP